ncbi:MAG: hypothetical protein ACLUVC_02160 [Longibaculum sp.]
MELKELQNKNRAHLLPLDIQLFAEGGDGGEGGSGGDNITSPAEQLVPKKEFDKLASELASIKREQREKLTLEQQKELEIQEKDTKIAELEKKITKSTLESGLSASGLDQKYVKSLTDAILDGDTDSIIKNLNKALEEIKTKHNQELEAVKLDSTPRPANGTNGGEGEKEITKEDFNKMNYLEKLELKEKQPELYKKFMK